MEIALAVIGLISGGFAIIKAIIDYRAKHKASKVHVDKEVHPLSEKDDDDTITTTFTEDEEEIVFDQNEPSKTGLSSKLKNLYNKFTSKDNDNSNAVEVSGQHVNKILHKHTEVKIVRHSNSVAQDEASNIGITLSMIKNAKQNSVNITKDENPKIEASSLNRTTDNAKPVEPTKSSEPYKFTVKDLEKFFANPEVQEMFMKINTEHNHSILGNHSVYMVEAEA